jgi:hypothetical protein
MHLDGFAYIDVKLCKEGQSLVKPDKCGLFIFRMTLTAANSFKNCADVFFISKKDFHELNLKICS